MTIRNLEGFFAPTSVLVIGPSRHPEAVEHRLREQLQQPENKLRITDLQLSSDEPILTTIGSVETMAELAISLVDVEQQPEVIRCLAASGCKAVLLPSPAYESWPEAVLQECREAARDAQLRLIGPGTLGYSIPATGLNLLLGARPAAAGDLAFVSRSGAVLNATLSWADAHKVGFSAVVGLGDRTDVDVGDLVDYFAQDMRTRAILLHLENVSSPRKFLSAARAAARNKPVIVLRTGIHDRRAPRVPSLAAELTTTDAAYDAAFRRAGMIRVQDLDEMFEALETLSRVRVPKCEALTILTNGRSLANLASDRLEMLDGNLAPLSQETQAGLSAFRRPGTATSTSAANAPVILREDLSPQDLQTAIGLVLKDTASDGALILQSPTAFTSLSDIAGAIAEAAKKDKRRLGRRKALVAGMIGDDRAVRAILDAAKVPCYSSPAEAARSVMHLARDARSKEFLMAAPPSLPSDFSPDRDTARDIIDAAYDMGKTYLDFAECHALLASYQIDAPDFRLCNTPEACEAASGKLFDRHEHCEVVLLAEEAATGRPVYYQRGLLRTADHVREAARLLLQEAASGAPALVTKGYALRDGPDELSISEFVAGLCTTSDFGPTLVFGQGGEAVTRLRDITIDLPPLDLNLANAMVRRTRISRSLSDAERAALALTMAKVSQMRIDFPAIDCLDINPLVFVGSAPQARSIQIALRPKEDLRNLAATGSRLAIAPYPKEWESDLSLKSGHKLRVRPVRPEDEDLFAAFFEKVSPEDLRLRFFAPVKDISHRFLARLTQLDYERAMALAAVDPATGELLGVVRLHIDPDQRSGEYAVMVRSDLKGIGLGWALMRLIIDYARAKGLETITGEVLKENTSMLNVCEALGFRIVTSEDDPGVVHVTLPVADYSHKDV